MYIQCGRKPDGRWRWGPYKRGTTVINWIEQCHIGRRQRVVVGREVSNLKLVYSGVPQGSVGPPTMAHLIVNIHP